MDCDNVRNPDTLTDDNFVRWSDTVYKNLTTFRSSTGQEPHGISNEGTKFNSDYSLRAGSPEINAGCVIVGFNDRGPDAYKGSKPDIGAFEYLDVPAGPDLSTSSKATSKGTVSTGESVTYTIRIVNTGGLLTTTVRMTDTLPAGLEYITGTLTATPGTVWVPPGTVGLPPGSTIYWQGNLSNTSSAEIRFRVLVTADDTEALVNTAEIDDGQGSVIRRSAIVIVNGVSVYLPMILRQ